MIFKKPIIFPVFGTGANGLYNDRRFLSYKHLVHVVESKSVKISNNEDFNKKRKNHYKNEFRKNNEENKF